jgi:hypothetical protein
MLTRPYERVRAPWKRIHVSAGFDLVKATLEHPPQALPGNRDGGVDAAHRGGDFTASQK